MSNIQSLITEIGKGGYQDASRYSIIFEIGGNSQYKIPPERVIGIDLPGPKYEFINCNYWLGNQFFRMPVGLKFEEMLIAQVIVPEDEDNNFFKFLKNYTNTNFNQLNRGRLFEDASATSTNSFSWKRANFGTNIQVQAYDRKGDVVGSYNYGGCYLEKILPFRFAADKSEPQTMTLSFLVGGMFR
jgi:hypothetical protein